MFYISKKVIISIDLNISYNNNLISVLTEFSRIISFYFSGVFIIIFLVKCFDIINFIDHNCNAFENFDINCKFLLLFILSSILIIIIKIIHQFSNVGNNQTIPLFSNENIEYFYLIFDFFIRKKRDHLIISNIRELMNDLNYKRPIWILNGVYIYTGFVYSYLLIFIKDEFSDFFSKNNKLSLLLDSPSYLNIIRDDQAWHTQWNREGKIANFSYYLQVEIFFILIFWMLVFALRQGDIRFSSFLSQNVIISKKFYGVFLL